MKNAPKPVISKDVERRTIERRVKEMHRPTVLSSYRSIGLSGSEPQAKDRERPLDFARGDPKGQILRGKPVVGNFQNDK